MGLRPQAGGKVQSRCYQRLDQRTYIDWVTPVCQDLGFTLYLFLIRNIQGYYLYPSLSDKESEAQESGFTDHWQKYRSVSQGPQRARPICTSTATCFHTAISEAQEQRGHHSGGNWGVWEYLSNAYRTCWLLGEEPHANLIQEVRGLLLSSKQAAVVKTHHQFKWWYARVAFLSMVSLQALNRGFIWKKRKKTKALGKCISYHQKHQQKVFAVFQVYTLWEKGWEEELMSPKYALRTTWALYICTTCSISSIGK